MGLRVINKVLALDVGEKRIGVAVASMIARLPRALPTLVHDGTVYQRITDYIMQESIDAIVVGRPRNLSGEETAQTRYTYDFVAGLSNHISLPIELQDETLTSRQAEAELKARGKPFEKGDIDALAAVYILEDYLRSYTDTKTRVS